MQVDTFYNPHDKNNNSPAQHQVIYFKAEYNERIVDHKPSNLLIRCLYDNSSFTHTLAIKISVLKIKRKMNRCELLDYVYLQLENELDSLGAFDRHNSFVNGKKLNRRKHRSKIGLKDIYSNLNQIPSNSNSNEFVRLASADSQNNFLYEVETKGGETAGRIKQKYVLLQKDNIYQLILPSYYQLANIQVKQKDGDLISLNFTKEKPASGVGLSAPATAVHSSHRATSAKPRRAASAVNKPVLQVSTAATSFSAPLPAQSSPLLPVFPANSGLEGLDSSIIPTLESESSIYSAEFEDFRSSLDYNPEHSTDFGLEIPQNVRFSSGFAAFAGESNNLINYAGFEDFSTENYLWDEAPWPQNEGNNTGMEEFREGIGGDEDGTTNSSVSSPVNQGTEDENWGFNGSENNYSSNTDNSSSQGNNSSSNFRNFNNSSSSRQKRKGSAESNEEPNKRPNRNYNYSTMQSTVTAPITGYPTQNNEDPAMMNTNPSKVRVSCCSSDDYCSVSNAKSAVYYSVPNGRMYSSNTSNLVHIDKSFYFPSCVVTSNNSLSQNFLNNNNKIKNR
jgi:hypothetical protein